MALSGSLKSSFFGNTIARINVSKVRLCNVLRLGTKKHFGKGFGKHGGLAKNATITN